MFPISVIQAICEAAMLKNLVSRALVGIYVISKV